jgi:hypothetical protein
VTQSKGLVKISLYSVPLISIIFLFGKYVAKYKEIKGGIFFPSVLEVNYVTRKEELRNACKILIGNLKKPRRK